MIRGELQDGERVVPAQSLVEWQVPVREGWTVTIRPDEIDTNTTPLDFEVGRYSAHDHRDFLAKRLVFIVVVAEVYGRERSLLGSEEIVGVEWRRSGRPQDLHIGQADVDKLVTTDERKWLTTNAVYHAIQAGGS
ncbi:hypothetical protein [Amycolatopsis lurida]|uniref:hypothetical protein n=1 Tax=Amycolatopsis lurida TaxID=31959 RepID=UPI0036632FBE